MALTTAEAHEHIASEGARNGLNLEQCLEMIHPQVLSQATPQELVDHWDHYQQSHILARSTHPELAEDPGNIFLEEAGPNQARGNRPATQAEVDDAMEEQLRDFNDQDYDDNGIPDHMEPDVSVDVDPDIMLTPWI